MRIKLFVLVGIFSLVFAGYALAHCGHCGIGEAHAEDAAVTEGANAICLCGMSIAKDKAVTVEYEGKTYYFCHKDCADAFNKDPKAAIEKMSAAVTEKADDVADAMDEVEDAGDVGAMDDVENAEVSAAPAVEKK